MLCLLGFGFWDLGFAAPQAPPDLSLASLVACARAQHPRIASAAAQVAAAKAEVDGSQAALFPAVTATSGYSSTGTDNGAPVSVERDKNYLQVGATQTVYDFGQTSAKVRASSARLEAARAQFALTDSDVVLGVVEAYLDAVLADRLLLTEEKVFAARKQLRDQVQTLFRAGVRARSDLTRAQISLQNSRIAVDAARAQAVSSRVRLRDAVGLTSLADGPLEDLLAAAPPSPDLDALAREAPNRRADLTAQREQTAAARADENAARAERRPVLTTTTSYLIRDRNVNMYHAPGGNTWSVNAAIGWTNFNWFLNKSSVDAARARAEAASAGMNDLQRQVVNEVYLAGEALIEASERIGTAADLVATAGDNLNLVKARYQGGAATILDVADAEMQLNEAEVMEWRARAEAWSAYARLRRQAGLALPGW